MFNQSKRPQYVSENSVYFILLTKKMLSSTPKIISHLWDSKQELTDIYLVVYGPDNQWM